MIDWSVRQRTDLLQGRAQHEYASIGYEQSFWHARRSQFLAEGQTMSAESVQAASMAFKKVVIERALGAELSHHLGYPPGATPPPASSNFRNGATGKTVKTEDGPVRVEVPRDRYGSPVALAAWAPASSFSSSHRSNIRRPCHRTRRQRRLDRPPLCLLNREAPALFPVPCSCLACRPWLPPSLTSTRTLRNTRRFSSSSDPPASWPHSRQGALCIERQFQQRMGFAR